MPDINHLWRPLKLPLNATSTTLKTSLSLRQKAEIFLPVCKDCSSPNYFIATNCFMLSKQESPGIEAVVRMQNSEHTFCTKNNKIIDWTTKWNNMLLFLETFLGKNSWQIFTLLLLLKVLKHFVFFVYLFSVRLWWKIRIAFLRFIFSNPLGLMEN